MTIIVENKPLTNTAYARAVLGLLSNPKESKKGLRAMMKNRKLVQLSHAITGIGTEVGELLEAMQPYILGQQLTAQLRRDFKDESGDLLFYAHAAAKVLGVKPRTRSTQRINVNKLNGTILERLMAVNTLGTAITSAHKKMYYGLELNTETIATNVLDLIDTLTELTWQLLGHAPAETMKFNLDKLYDRFDGGEFNVEAIHAKDAAKAAQKAQTTH